MMSVYDEVMAAINVVRGTAAARKSEGRVSTGQCGLDRRRYPIDRIRLFDQRYGGELGRRGIDMAARSNNEGHALAAQPGRDRPHVLTLQIDVENGKVEAALVGLGQSLGNRVAGAVDTVPQRFKKIFEHHGDEG